MTERGLVPTLRGALFISGRAELDPTIDVLARLVSVLRGFPDSDITIEGHTDSLGSEGYNYNLSQRRADSLKRYLLAAGLIIPRIMALGRGGTRPVATNATLNRAKEELSPRSHRARRRWACRDYPVVGPARIEPTRI